MRTSKVNICVWICFPASAAVNPPPVMIQSQVKAVATTATEIRSSVVKIGEKPFLALIILKSTLFNLSSPASFL